MSIGHISPEAAEGGAIALIEPGDIIAIDIPARSINVLVEPTILAQRRAAMIARGRDGFMPQPRPRNVSPALQAYAALTTSAARGAVRDVTQIRPKNA